MCQSHSKKADTAYRKIPAIHDAKITTDVYQRTLETPVTITYHELLSLSPEVRAQVRDAITSKRVPPKDIAQAATLQETFLTEEELSYLMPDEVLVPFNEVVQPTSIITLSNPSRKQTALPSDVITVDDPIEQYYKTLGKG